MAPRGDQRLRELFQTSAFEGDRRGNPGSKWDWPGLGYYRKEEKIEAIVEKVLAVR